MEILGEPLRFAFNLKKPSTMACPSGYIEVNGECTYVFGNETGVGPDGTPLPQKSGGFWDWMKKKLPDILVGVGTVWESAQKSKQSSGSNPAQPVQPPADSKMPVWAWVLISLAVLVLFVFLLRRPK